MDSERPAELPPEKPAHRHVSLRREETGRYTVTNARGGTLSIGGSDDDFTAVELLLSAIAACSSIDVDSLVWATGFRPDYSWIDAPEVTDDAGLPRHDGGATGPSSACSSGVQANFASSVSRTRNVTIVQMNSP